MIAELTAIGISLASLHMPYEGQNQFNPGLHAEINDVVRAGVFVNTDRVVAGDVGGQVYLTRSDIAGVPTSVRLFGAFSSGYSPPVIGGMEFVVGSVVVLLTPKVREHPWTLGFALRKEI